jgi:hypothetical protein
MAGEGSKTEALLEELSVALVEQFEGPVGNYMRRHPNSVGSEVDALYEELKALGDAAAVPRLRELIAGLPKFAKGSRELLGQLVETLEGRYVAPDEGNRLELAPHGRTACRGCKKKLAKGELRLGADALAADGEETTTHWYHVACGLEKSPAELVEALAKYTGDVPDRKRLEVRAAALAEEKRAEALRSLQAGGKRKR